MRLNNQQIKTLEPCIKNVTLSGKSVNVQCSGNASGKRALAVLRSVYNPSSVELMDGTDRIAMFVLLQFWLYPLRYRDFTLKFKTSAEAVECANDLAAVITEAVAEDVIGDGISNEGSLWPFGSGSSSSDDKSFFKSNFFYGMVAILLVLIVTFAGIKIVQQKK